MEPKNDSIHQGDSWTLPIDEEGVLTLPDALLEHLGWQEGDELEWIDQEDGSFVLRKLTEPEDAEN
jgi:bifunctional DNA-binding transcriptional regulator/antitoxin component of YhaV-PrlF toxin-antitoxin module